MDGVLQEEEQFDILGLIFYCLKKWLIIALACIFGAAVFSILHMTKDNYVDDVVNGGASFYSITEFLDGNSAISPESPAAEGVYNLTALRVMGLMSSGKVKDIFIKDAGVLAEMRVIFDNPARTPEYDFKAEFAGHFNVWNSTYNFGVEIKAKLDSEIKVKSAIKLLDKYIDIAMAHAYENSNDAYIPPDKAIEKIAPVEVMVKKEAGGSLLSELITGGLIGAVAGIAVVLLIYFIDPRVKSFSQLKPYAKNCVAKIKDESAEREPALNIAARIKDDNTVLFAAAKNSGPFVSALAKSIAKECVDAGFKTLFIDFNDVGKGGALLSDYIAGKVQPAQAGSGYDELTVAAAYDWAAMLAKKSVMEKLKAKYDKIIFAYSDDYSGGAVVLSDIADKAVLAVNQRYSRLKDVKALIDDFAKPGMCVGAYIYNSL